MKDCNQIVLNASQIGLILAAALTLGATAAQAEIKIGFQAPTTGFAAADGASGLLAAELAVADINAAGGMAGETVVLVPYDDQAQPQQSITVANKLVNQDQVDFAISGSYSEPTRAAATVFQEAGVPYIASYTTHPEITKTGDFVFRPFKLGPAQARSAAFLIKNTLKAATVSEVILDNDMGHGLQSGFEPAAEELGLKVLGTYTFGMKDRQFGSVVASIKRDNPDAVFVAGNFFHGGPLAIQLRAAGVTAPIIGGQGFDSDALISIAGPAAEGIYVMNGFDRDNADPRAMHLMEKVRADKADSPAVAAAVYSAFMLLDDAVERAGSADKSKVRDALQATTDFPHLYGTLSRFTEDREAILPTPIIVVRDGKFVSAGNSAE